MQLNLLHRRLGEFGLDPMEWCIEITGKFGSLMKIEISSVADQGFRLEGWAERGMWLTMRICEF